ncbi:MAG: PEP-CTERM sorting domain-containing protein [Planctomycetes bacterium]|nr:PEP-CTERM sorting domain-containing protein [Planctomycetota bacterium]
MQHHTKTLLTLAVVAMVSIALTATSANADLLVYEPFAYPDGNLNGQGGALGTTGVWATEDTGWPDGWLVHPEGELTGIVIDDAGTPNVFDGTVANLPTSGGFVGMPGPEDRGLPAGTDQGTGQLNASIALDPSVTATFTSDTTTWFSFVSVRGWDRNEGSPQFMIGTDPTSGRGLTMANSGNGIGGGGGPSRGNLFDIYPQFFRDGVDNHTPGGYQNDTGTNGAGTFGLHDGQQLAFGSGNDNTASGQLNENGQPRTQTMLWEEFDPDGNFGPPNIVVGKIQWDADTGGEDIISVVRFLQDETLDEAAFDALIDSLPALSSANWESNKPDLDQSQFDSLSFSSLKFFVDEIRLGTTFSDIVGVDPLPSDLNNNGFVDFEDLTILLANWNKDVGAADGNLVEPLVSVVNFADLTVLLADWTGPGPAGSPEAALGSEAVPEPSTLLLGVIATLGLSFYRRRRRRAF